MTPKEFIEKIGEILGRILVFIISIGMFIVGFAGLTQIKPVYEQYFHDQHIAETEGVISDKRIWIKRHYSQYGVNTTENIDFKLEGNDLVFNYNEHRQKYDEIKNGVEEGMKVKFIHDKIGLIDGVHTPAGWILTWEEAKAEQKYAPLAFLAVGLVLIAIGIAANWPYIRWIRKKIISIKNQKENLSC